MADINVSDVVNCDRETVFTVFRDKITELIPFIPDIDDITVMEREEPDANTVKMVNLWKASYDKVPAVARSFVKPDMLKWIDYATWNQNEWECNWRIEVGTFTEAVSCQGTNKYLSEGDDKTRVVITGTLEIDVKKVPGVPKIGAGRTGKLIEKFVVPMISANLTGVYRGLELYIKDM